MSAQLLPIADRATTRQALRRLLRRHRAAIALPLLVLAAGSLAGVAVPPLLGALVDAALDTEVSVAPLLLGLAVALLAGAVLSGAGAALVVRNGERLLAEVREEVLARALAIPQAELEQAGTGDLVARISGDVEAVQEAMRRGVPAFALAGLDAGLTVVGLTLLDPRLALAALFAVPVQLGGIRWYLRRSRPLYARDRALQGALVQRLAVAVSGARTARALRRTDEQDQQVQRASREAVEASVRAFRVQVLFYSRLNAAELVGLSAVIITGFIGVRGGWFGVGAASAAALYVLRLFDPVTSLLSLVDTVQSAFAALARLVGVTEVPPQPGGGTSRPPRGAAVQACGIRAGYRVGADVLHDVHLALSPGERVAVVGASGAGKSTLARVLVGVLLPRSGEVRVAGLPVHALVPGAVLLVPQDVHVFAGRLADDLRLAAPDADDTALRAALHAVGATWVDALPDGLDTIIGSGGRTLPPAHAQAVALARVLLADPAVVVLDEATAHGGGSGARSLERAVEAVLVGRTAVVVAHRLSQAVAADRVVVLEAGRVVEHGPHSALIAAGGRYAALWESWTSAR